MIDFFNSQGFSDKYWIVCADPSMASGSHRHRVIAGAVSAVSAAGALGVAAAILLLKKLKAKAPVTCGVQTNENRLF